VGVDWNNFLHEDAPGAPPPNFLLFHHFANFVSFKRTGRLGHWFYCYLHILCREIGLWKHLFSWHERYFLIGAPGASTNRVNRIPTLASVLMLGMGYSMFQCLQFVNKSDRVVRGPFPVHFSMRARLMCFKLQRLLSKIELLSFIWPYFSPALHLRVHEGRGRRK
jgi:hypothetical protein